ncbi:hypothetical protein MBLNU459_g3733t2 [Dothideomycetes sp. NU459]
MTSTLSPAATADSGLGGLLNGNSGTAQNDSGQSFLTLLAAIYTAAASFGAHRPKTYLVAERERLPLPPPGVYQWILPVFTTSNATLIQKCGLDAYFFLRFLRMLLKIFIPLSAVVLPILLPINQLSGDGTVKGVDQLGWQNISSKHTHRLWAHLIMSILSIAWILYVCYDEFRGYIRIRQAYLTSPEHRIRASATTVLVSGIPRKWLTVEALNGLYDVFPGGIRNIWINRNFDPLADKVKERDKIARKLEGAETDLIRKCVKQYKKAEQKKAKDEGRAKRTKIEKAQDREDENAQAEQLAQGEGMSSGDPHQIPHNIQEALDEIDNEEHRRDPSPDRRFRDPLLKIGQGFGQGLGAVGHGLGAIGNIGRNLVGEVTGDVNRVIRNVNETVDSTNAGPGAGFAMDDALYQAPTITARPHIAPQRDFGGTSPLPSTTKSSAEKTVPTISITPRTPVKNSDTQQSTQDLPHGPARPTGLRQQSDVDALERGTPSKRASTSPIAATHSDASETTVGHAGLDGNDRVSSDYLSAKAVPNNNHGYGSKARKFLMGLKPASPIPFPSPQPHTAEEEEYPLSDVGRPRRSEAEDDPNKQMSPSKWAKSFGSLMFWKKDSFDEEIKEEYPEAFNEELAEDQDGEPVWKQYIKPEDRDTLREPLFAPSWFPRLPLVGKKIDKVYFLRKELARLNVEIELDQKNLDKYPFMNSAFIQFNHQVAAHMACQSLSHHIPQHMTPRLVEITPSDVLWDNMSMKWWERYVRTGVVFAIAVGLIVLYTIPVTFTGLLSQIDTISKEYSWLSWLAAFPREAKAIIQGVLPPILLSVMLSLVPIIFRVLVKLRGVPNGNAREAGVQDYYFAFLFIQVFLVVTLSAGLTSFFTTLTEDTASIPQTLAQNLPNASNYFFSYLTVQALSNSASALVQVGSLLVWFVWAPFNDSTARQKWRRQTSLSNVQWGSFFPPFTNFAVIGIIYSTISPLIMVFNLIVFSLYWVTQRYNVLYVYQFRNDTGGLLFPKAINQLFVGVYVLELCLIGLFFLARDQHDKVSAIPQAIIMIVVLVATIIFHWLLNEAFAPLFRYLPITLEDDAVIRDEEFARAQNQKFGRLIAEEGEGREEDDIQSVLEERERRSAEEEERAKEDEHKRIQESRRSGLWRSRGSDRGSQIMDTKPTRPWNGDRWRQVKNISQPVQQLRRLRRPLARRDSYTHGESGNYGSSAQQKPTATDVDPQKLAVDEEAQQAVGDVLYSGYSDELEDLTPEERDTLIRYAFQHSALRARRPVVWIPRDILGVSDDEIARCTQMSTVEQFDPETEKRENKTSIWISNEGTALDAKGRVVFRKSPPDFANIDLINL